MSKSALLWNKHLPLLRAENQKNNTVLGFAYIPVIKHGNQGL